MKHLRTNPSGRGTTRRTFLKQIAALGGVSAGALLTACGSSATTTATAVPSTTQPTTAPAPATAMPTTAATTAAATTNDATAAATTETETATTGQSATPNIVAAASAFLQTLDEAQRTGVSFSYPTGQTTATAANFGFRVGEQFGDAVWSNYPVSDVSTLR